MKLHLVLIVVGCGGLIFCSSAGAQVPLPHIAIDAYVNGLQTAKLCGNLSNEELQNVADFIERRAADEGISKARLGELTAASETEVRPPVSSQDCDNNRLFLIEPPSGYRTQPYKDPLSDLLDAAHQEKVDGLSKEDRSWVDTFVFNVRMAFAAYVCSENGNSFDAADLEAVRGRVSNVSQAVDPELRQYLVRAAVQN